MSYNALVVGRDRVREPSARRLIDADVIIAAATQTQ